jgi:hypothetical protein
VCNSRHGEPRNVTEINDHVFVDYILDMIEIPALPYSFARLALQSRAVFKRLGFLAEGRDNSAALIELCRARLTAGIAKLDPALDCKRLISR